VHVALVPIGSGGSLNAAKAAEVISLLEPNIVIPMHYATYHSKPDNLEPLNKFTKEMGLTTIETLPSLKVSLSSLPEETHVYTLEYDHARNGTT
jgi:L-ascorbate metabolism protein UlaG (beta-lactamase superfamily)